MLLVLLPPVFPTLNIFFFNEAGLQANSLVFFTTMDNADRIISLSRALRICWGAADSLRCLLKKVSAYT